MSADWGAVHIDPLIECVAIIARHHGLSVHREAISAGLPKSNNRIVPSLLNRAAKRAGLDSRSVKSRLGRIQPTLLPAVVLLKDESACVLKTIDFKSQKAVLTFPELPDSEVEMSIDELESRYLGYIHYLHPRFKLDRRVEESSSQEQGHWFWSAVGKNKRLYFDVVITAILINVFALSMPLFVMNVYDRVVPNQALETLWVLAAGIALVLVSDFILRNLRTWFVDQAAQKADRQLSARIMEHVLGMRLEARPVSVGSFAAGMHSFEAVRSFVSSAVVVALVDLPFIFLFLAIIAWIAVPMSFPVLAGIFVVLTVATVVQWRMRALSQEIMKVSAQRNASLVEGLASLESVKSFSGESDLQQRWEQTTSYLSLGASKNRFLSGLLQHTAMWAQHSVAVVVIIVGVYLIIEGNITQGGLIAAYLLSSRAMAPVSQIAGLLAQYHQAATAYRALDDIMQSPLERPPGRSWVSRPEVAGQIEFKNVVFRYPNSESEALSNVSFTIKAGERVGILGRNGSGKSTLNRLIMALYQPTEGSIKIDGVDLRQFDPSELRQQIGYVPQDISLFFGSIRDNLISTYPDATDADLLAAARTSGLSELIDAHPMGFDLPVGERGEYLSGGQRQSVGLARAVIRKPPILLLDEPTGAMDHSSEEAVKTNLGQFSKGRTLVVVTHRSSLLDLVDRLIVIDSGKIVADGPKADVVAALRSGRIGKAQ